MPEPYNIPLNHTLDFVLPYLQSAPKRILEVGCGDGRLAARLKELDHHVIAIDANEKAVAAARSRGLDARLAEWPAFHDDPFDAVLFVRALHHISPLDAAVAKAAELLRSPDNSPSPSWTECDQGGSTTGRGEGLLHGAHNSKGVVIIEDFAFDEIDARTAEWLRGVVILVSSCGTLNAPDSRFLSKLLQSENPPTRGCTTTNTSPPSTPPPPSPAHCEWAT